MSQSKAIRTFTGAVAIITGGASGIGAALGRELAKRGCEVVLADLQIDLANQVAATIQAAGGKATAAVLDVTDFEAVNSLVQETVKRAGRLDYMFNNAGITMMGPASAYEVEDWNTIVDVNLRGVIHGVQAAYQVMQRQGFGHIVNMASLAGLLASPEMIGYITTKHAVVGLSNALRIEAAASGIRVSVFCPGFIRTPILDQCGKYGKMLMEYSPQQLRKMQDMFESCKPMPPDNFAAKALDAIAKNDAIIVIPGWWKLIWWFGRLFPSWGLRLSAKSYQVQLEERKQEELHSGMPVG